MDLVLKIGKDGITVSLMANARNSNMVVALEMLINLDLRKNVKAGVLKPEVR